jgi:predicted RNA methylase
MVPYSHIVPHRQMIRDSARTGAFRDAIKKMVKPGAAVLDVGAGTGILSLFAAQAGARVVYAVERTPIAGLAARLAERNGFANVVRVIHADIGHAALPERVDVIVAEWLGSIGVNENLLLPVLVARDRWLKPGGVIIPAEVTAWVAPADLAMQPDATFFMEKPYGLDLSPLAEASVHDQLCQTRRVHPGELVATPLRLWKTDTRTATVHGARLPARAELAFEFKQKRRVNALVAWFDAVLAPDCRLSNAPDAPETHWGQLMLPLDRRIECAAGDRLYLSLTCIPTGLGQTQMAWSVSVNGGRWEHHDTRVYSGATAPSMSGQPARPQPAPRPAATQASAAGPAAKMAPAHKAGSHPGAPAAANVAAANGGTPPITRFLARLAADPDLLVDFLRQPAEVLQKHGVPKQDQSALLSRNPHAIEAAMVRS